MASMPCRQPRDKNTAVRIRYAFRERMSTLPMKVSGWKYKRFLEAIHVQSKAEKKHLDEIVRDELKKAERVNTSIKLNHIFVVVGRTVDAYLYIAYDA